MISKQPDTWNLAARFTGQIERTSRDETENPTGSAPCGQTTGMDRKGVGRRILRELEARPGLSVAEVQRILECSHPNAARHLRLLRRAGEVAAERENREIRYFLATHTHVHIRILPYLRDPRKHRAMRILAQNTSREWNFNELAKEADTNHSLISGFIDKLEKRRLVRVWNRNGRYFVRANESLINALKDHERSRWCREAERTRETVLSGQERAGSQAEEGLADGPEKAIRSIRRPRPQSGEQAQEEPIELLATNA